MLFPFLFPQLCELMTSLWNVYFYVLGKNFKNTQRQREQYNQLPRIHQPPATSWPTFSSHTRRRHFLLDHPEAYQPAQHVIHKAFGISK